MTEDDRVGAIIYSNNDIDSTPLRCCLAADDFVENPNACDEEIVETTEYEYVEDAPEG